MGSNAVLLILGAYLISALVKGVAGLGFSTVCLGLMAGFLEVRTAIPLVILPSVCSNLLVMVEARGFGRILRRFLPLYAATIPGLLIGLWWLTGADNRLVGMVLGGVLCCYGVWGLLNLQLRLPQSIGRRLAVPTGLATGLLNGFTGAQVMPIVPFMMSLDLDRREFVQAVNISFTLSSLVMLGGLAWHDLLNMSSLGLSFAGIVPVLLATTAGSILRRRLSADQFRRIVLVVLVGLGLNLLL